MRLVDADYVLAHLKPYEPSDEEWSVTGGTVLRLIHNAIDNAPTVDTAAVTRCKNCKHFKNYGKTSLLIDGENIKAGWCHRRAQYDEEYRMPPDGFCSYGERKDSDNAT